MMPTEGQDFHAPAEPRVVAFPGAAPGPALTAQALRDLEWLGRLLTSDAVAYALTEAAAGRRGRIANARGRTLELEALLAGLQLQCGRAVLALGMALPPEPVPAARQRLAEWAS